MGTDYIRLSFPINPAYVSSARLTASSIANRIMLDIDEIEDIKTAVSEACTYIIKHAPLTKGSNFEICFMPRPDEISVEIVANVKSDKAANSNPTEEMSLLVIKALVDEFSITTATADTIAITMTKRHKKGDV